MGCRPPLLAAGLLALLIAAACAPEDAQPHLAPTFHADAAPGEPPAPTPSSRSRARSGRDSYQPPLARSAGRRLRLQYLPLRQYPLQQRIRTELIRGREGVVLEFDGLLVAAGLARQ